MITGPLASARRNQRARQQLANAPMTTGSVPQPQPVTGTMQAVTPPQQRRQASPEQAQKALPGFADSLMQARAQLPQMLGGMGSYGGALGGQQGGPQMRQASPEQAKQALSGFADSFAQARAQFPGMMGGGSGMLGRLAGYGSRGEEMGGPKMGQMRQMMMHPGIMQAMLMAMRGGNARPQLVYGG